MKRIAQSVAILVMFMIGVVDAAGAATPVKVAPAKDAAKIAPAAPAEATPTSTDGGAELAERWKGPGRTQKLQLGGLLGVDSYASQGAAGVLIAADFMVSEQGVIDDITDHFNVGVEFGPAWFGPGAIGVFQVYGRWDFVMDSTWTLFSAAGLGMQFLPSGFGSGITAYPHVALGALAKTKWGFDLRGEISHAFTGIGVVFGL